MASLFISDLHLCAERPEKLALFYRLIEGPARQAHAVYILGDLFEVWLGDDDRRRSPHREIIQALSSLRAHGVPLYLMHGNRDFLMADRLAAAANCQLLSDPSVVTLYGINTLLMHGDTLCTDDIDYQAFRRKVRDPKWQRKVLRLPLVLRRFLAKRMRKDSKTALKDKTPTIMDVTQQAVEQAMTEHQVTRLIHGHTHRPGIHQFTVHDQTMERIVLGDWYENDNVLEINEHHCRLIPLEEFLQQ